MKIPRIAAALFLAAGLLGAGTGAAQAGAPEGQEFAVQVCAGCHGVLPADKISPRENAPAFPAIAAKPFWTRTSLMVWFQTPHDQMPDLILKPEDKENLVDYILSLRDEQ